MLGVLEIRVHMKELKRAIARTPILGPAIIAAFRAKIDVPCHYFRRAKTAVGYLPLLNLVKWLFKSKETDNFEYDLEEHNKRHLASLIADALNMEFHTVMAYIIEIEEDEELKRHIADMTANSDFASRADWEVGFGRRIGWYALARALKPQIIVETGVHKGLGSYVLTAALKKNKEEGFEGKVLF